MAVELRRLNEDDVMVDINTTPLIDVMLVLLIMLIITIPIQTHAVKLDMPRDTPPPALVEPEVVNLEIDFDGTLIWNGVTVPDRGTLETYLRGAAAKAPQPELHIAPNRLVKYGAVAMVLAEAQRLGVVKVGIVGAERFME
ncbi:MAG TPA: biopolymer transporter ExbD [Stellaceae bacterium]|nr:biopolymer transporter ExbD [Stellaceae bacterium]